MFCSLGICCTSCWGLNGLKRVQCLTQGLAHSVQSVHIGCHRGNAFAVVEGCGIQKKWLWVSATSLHYLHRHPRPRLGGTSSFFILSVSYGSGPVPFLGAQKAVDANECLYSASHVGGTRWTLWEMLWKVCTQTSNSGTVRASLLF